MSLCQQQSKGWHQSRFMWRNFPSIATFQILERETTWQNANNNSTFYIWCLKLWQLGWLHIELMCAWNKKLSSHDFIFWTGWSVILSQHRNLLLNLKLRISNKVLTLELFFEKNLFLKHPILTKKKLSLILMLDSWLDFQFVKDLIGYGRWCFSSIFLTVRKWMRRSWEPFLSNF